VYAGGHLCAALDVLELLPAYVYRQFVPVIEDASTSSGGIAHRVSSEYRHLSRCDQVYEFCGALFWFAEWQADFVYMNIIKILEI
jgi:hypothetical protein